MGGVLTYTDFDVRTDGSFTTAVPEPSTWAMALAGLAGLGFAARRRATSADARLKRGASGLKRPSGRARLERGFSAWVAPACPVIGAQSLFVGTTFS